MNKNYLSKTLNVSGIIGGGIVLVVSIPALIVSHAKYKKEHPELKGTNLEMRDDLMVTCAASSMTVIATKAICDAIIGLKKNNF